MLSLVLLLVTFELGTKAQTTNAYTQAGLAQPTVMTDKTDYLPGEVAVITGKGWLLDQKIIIDIEEEPIYDYGHTYYADVKPDGT